MGRHELLEPCEQDVIEMLDALLGVRLIEPMTPATTLYKDKVQLCIPLHWTATPQVMSALASIRDKHPGGLPVILCLHNGPSRTKLKWGKAAVTVREPFKAFVGGGALL